MNINGILEYQKVDLELRKIESEIEKSDFAKAAKEAQQVFREAKEIAANCEKEAESLLAYYKKACAFYQENIKKVEDLSARVKEGADSLDVEKLKSQLSALNDRFARIEKDLQGINDRVDKLTSGFSGANKRGVNAKSSYIKNKAEYDALKKDREPKLVELRQKLQDLSPKLDKELLEKYNTLRKDKVYPSFVMLEAPNKCGGCRMEMALNSLTKLKENGIFACESCRRIIYVDKK